MQSPVGEGLHYAGLTNNNNNTNTNDSINTNNSNNRFLFASSSPSNPHNNCISNNNMYGLVEDGLSPPQRFAQQQQQQQQHHIMASAALAHFQPAVQDPPHSLWHHPHRHLFQSAPPALPQVAPAPRGHLMITPPHANNPPGQDPYSDLGSVFRMRMSSSPSPQANVYMRPQVGVGSPPPLPLSSPTCAVSSFKPITASAVFDSNNNNNNNTAIDNININKSLNNMKNNSNNNSNNNNNNSNSTTNGLGEEGDDEGERVGAACSRWPRDETQALLRIRSKLDSNFRDSAFKGPIWEEVSRKLGEEGFYRSAKKCKEKFENVYKYYKRTREGRAGRQDGKNYRFFEELEAFYSANHSQTSGTASGNNRPGSINYSGALIKQMELSELAPSQQPEVSGSAGLLSDTSDYNKDQEEEEEEELEEEDQEEGETQPEYSNPVISRKRKKGRMLSSDTCPSSSNNQKFLDGLVKQVMEKQEALYKKFMDALEKRDEERMAREEAYRKQEMIRFNHEYDLRLKQHAIAASRDAALVDFLQKVTGQTLQLDNPPAPASTTDMIHAETEAFSDEQEQEQDQDQEQEQEQEQQQQQQQEQEQEQEKPQQWSNVLVRLRAGMDAPEQDHCSENNRQTADEETAQVNPIPSSNPDTVQTQVSVALASTSLEQGVCHRMQIRNRCLHDDDHRMTLNYSNVPFNPEGLIAKEIMELQQMQQHQKFREEFDRIEQEQVINEEIEQEIQMMRRQQQETQQQQLQKQHPVMNASRDNNNSAFLTVIQKFAVSSDFSSIMAPSSSD